MKPIAIRWGRRESPEETFLMRVAVLTISDSVTKGEREDLSGPAVVAFCRGLGWEVTSALRVSDDPANIREQLRERAERESGRGTTRRKRRRLLPTGSCPEFPKRCAARAWSTRRRRCSRAGRLRCERRRSS